MTTFADQLYQYGGTPVSSGLPFTSGKIFFVDSVSGSNGNSGRKPSEALATVAAAVNLATAANGDIVSVAPWHTETITAATTTWSKAGVSIIGRGTGSYRPTFTFTTANTSAIGITAANMTLQNLRFIANFADIAGLITTTAAANLLIDSCHFGDTDSTHNALACLKTSTVDNAADRLTITNCTVVGIGTTANTAIVNIGQAMDRLTIQNNSFTLKVAGNSGLIYQPTTTKVLTNVSVKGNLCNFTGADAATGALLITTATTHTGVVQQNYVWGARAVATAVLVTASSGLKFFENYYQTVADKSGILLPVNA